MVISSCSGLWNVPKRIIEEVDNNRLCYATKEDMGRLKIGVVIYVTAGILWLMSGTLMDA